MSSETKEAPAAEAPPKPELFRYALIDLAVMTSLRPVVPKLRTSAAEPLFARDAAQKLLQVGPWAVRLSRAPEIESLLAEIGGDEPWGYYIDATIDIVSLRQTMRRFNLARLPGGGKEVLFRYWDPRVMKVFLDTATPAQLDALFQSIEKIEAADGSFEMKKPRRKGG